MKQVQDRPEISAIVTCYYEEKTIDEFHARLTRALADTGRSFEILLVNDGSTDATYAHLEAIFEKDPHVYAVMDLFKNAGQMAAQTAGIEHARGDALLFMDSDLQLDPEELPRLLAAYDAGNDVVSGCREHRQDAFWRRPPSWLANRIMRKVSQTQLRDFGCTFKLFNGTLLRAFCFGPFKPWRLAYVIRHAQQVAEVMVSHHPRRHGKSGWTFRKLFAYNMDNIVGLSSRLFQIIAGFGFLLAVLFLVRIAAAWVVDFSVLETITNGLILNSLVVAWLILLAVVCVIGEFVIRNFQVLQRYPAYIVKRMRKRD